MSASEIALSRAFVALWPTADAAARLHRSVGDCCPDEQAMPLPCCDLHCTVVFLGDLAGRDLAAIGDALDAVAGEPFALTFDSLEFWPGPSVLVACPCDVPAALTALHRTIAASTAAYRVPADPRPYRPHVTVRRRQRRVCDRTAILPCEWSCEEFVLAGSAAAPSTGRYRICRRWRLAGGSG